MNKIKKESGIIECDFCRNKGNWKNVIRNPNLGKKDGSDITVCNDCLNLYANHEYDKLTKRLKV